MLLATRNVDISCHESVSTYLLSFFLARAWFFAFRSVHRRLSGIAAVMDRKYMRILFLRFKLLGFRRTKLVLQFLVNRETGSALSSLLMSVALEGSASRTSFSEFMAFVLSEKVHPRLRSKILIALTA